jgi:Flp pilus assembly protein TadB
MKKHIVTCVKCGRQFDANEGGAYYPESRRYVCKRCVDKQKSEQADREKARKAEERKAEAEERKAEAEERKAEADERERVTGMRQSKAAMLVKIVVGVLFLFAAVSLAVQGNISSFVCGLVIGGALVAWGLVPYLKAKSGRR